MLLRNKLMMNYWLMKSEPQAYSIKDEVEHLKTENNQLRTELAMYKAIEQSRNNN